MWLRWGKKISPRNPFGHAKFLNFDLCRFRKLVKAKEMQTESSQPIMLRHRRRGHLVLLGPQDPPMRWIFQPVMCRTFLTSSHTYWWHIHLPLPVPHTYWQAPLAAPHSMYVLPLPALSRLLQSHQYLSEILFLWQGRSQYWGYLFMCWFIPSQGWSSG